MYPRENVEGGIPKLKTFISLAVGAFLICACNQVTTPTEGGGFLTAKFTLTDSTGKATTVFHSGQQFAMSFSVTNTRMYTITYHRGNSGPSVIFQILKGDSSIATSVDGYVFPMVVLGGYVAPGQAL